MSAAEGLPEHQPGADAAPVLDQPGTLEWIRHLARSEGISLRIRGGCMEPALRHGETVFVRARRLYFPGDLLAVGAPAGLVVHRFLGYCLLPGGCQVWTQADEAVRSDAAVRLGDVVGRVEQHSGEAVRVALGERGRALRCYLAAAWGGLRRVRRARGSDA